MSINLYCNGVDLQIIQSKILEIRGNRIMLDFHLAELYGVETRVLKQAVKWNIVRFPDDFMFELAEEEMERMVSQFVIPSQKPSEENGHLLLQNREWRCCLRFYVVLQQLT